MTKKNDDRKKKQSPQESGFEIRELTDGILPFPSPRLGAEQVLRELHEALDGHEFSSKKEVDAFISALNQHSIIPSTQKKQMGNAKHQAQDLAYQAMETADPIQSAKLCEKAIKLNPHCVDALMHLARLSCDDGDEMIEHIAMVVNIGERDLGAEYFRENKGHFWGLLETRPYMRARGHLAQLLLEAGRLDEAIGHYKAMLDLNPNDNQGVRDILLGCYLQTDNLEGARMILKQFEEDGSAVFYWARVLERHLAGDEQGALKELKQARKANKHVPKYLAGKKKMPQDMPDYYGFGDENEAIVCAYCLSRAWAAHPKAVEWLNGRK